MEIQLWRKILGPYRQAVDELVVKFNHMIQEYHNEDRYCPIEQIKGRVKNISSILEKCQRKGVQVEELEEKIEDIAGIRIICQFVEDIGTVVEIIRNRSDMTVKKEKDYITNSKKSGYRSYHMIVYYTVQTADESKRLEVEIQIRTLAMDFWATIEHSLQYKYKGNMPQEVRERLLRAAKAVDALDMEMAAVRGEIMDAQNSDHYWARKVSDILNNIENLYRTMNRREVIKIQDEFFRIYKANDITLLERFHKQLDILSESYRAQSLV